MYCTKCNSSIDDDSLYCPGCGEHIAVNEQKAKVNEAFTNNRNVIVKQLKSPIFLTVAILFSVIFAGQLVSMISGGITGVLTGVLPFVFMLIATIGLWQGYTAKDTSAASKALLRMSIYDAYTRVMYLISIIILSIVAALMFIVTLIGGLAAGVAADSLGAEDASSAFLGGGIVAAIVVLVVFAIIIAIVAIFKGIYAKRRDYFKHLAETAQTGNYSASKAPVIGSYILGGAGVLSAIFPVVLAISGIAIIDAVFGEFLIELGIYDFIIDTLNKMTASLTVSGVSSLVSGGYLVLSAVWMASVHKAEMDNKEAVTAECARLDEIEAATKEAIFAAEKKKRDEEAEKLRALEAERVAAEEKSRQAQAAMQEQQQQMMQMMMMQMMQANGMTMPTTQTPEKSDTEEVSEDVSKNVSEKVEETVTEEVSETVVEEIAADVEETADEVEETADEVAEPVAEEAEEASAEATE